MGAPEGPAARALNWIRRVRNGQPMGGQPKDGQPKDGQPKDGQPMGGQQGTVRLGSGRYGDERPPEQFGPDLLDEAKQPRNPISRRQIDTVLARSVGGIGFFFSLQTMPAMLAQVDSLGLVWTLVLALLLYGGVALVMISTLAKVGVRQANTFVAVSYLLALAAWPFLVPDPGVVLDGKPWLWYLCTVATSCAAIAFPVRWAAAYTVAAPVVYGVVRSLPSGGGADALLASLDTVYAILLGQVVLIIIFMLRQASTAVDVAQGNALGKYATAVRQHAKELERVEVDSIVHDSVLATLLSAASAGSAREADLVVGMARQAVARLNDAGTGPTGDETVIPFARVSHRIRRAAAAFVVPFTVIERDIDFLTLPVHASDALCSATVQAMVNSMQHAGPVDAALSRTLTMSGNLQGGCTIEVADAGAGFDRDAVPAERLGLRVSIMERVTSAGGAVTVRTAPGEGTVVTIEWPRSSDGQDEVLDQFATEELPALGLERDRTGGR